jgi:hypothetical protein
MADNDETKPRREIRIPVPDMSQVSDLAAKMTDKAKQINSNPPAWLYWAVGIAIIVLVQALRLAFHR